MSLPKRKQQHGHQRSLSALVYCLIVLAVALSGIATWQRYSQRQRSEPGYAAEKRLDTVLANTGIPDSWVPIGGPPQATAAAAMAAFACPPCQSSCWTQARRGCPACPFCGLAMVPQGVDQQGVKISLVGGAATAGISSPVLIQADATRPHADRGACTNCHTVVRSGVSPIGQKPAGAAWSNPKMLWQGLAAPAIPADAVKPTLIKEFGMEVYPAQGAGVKVTGIMGNSYASNAGLWAGDIILACNGAHVRGVRQFQQLVGQAPPEANAQIKILRNGRTRDLSIMVGEGEMEGFTPIQRP